MGKEDREKLRGNRVGVGKRQRVPVTIVFNISQSHTPAPGIHDWSSITFYFIANINHLASGTQSLTNMLSMGNPPTQQLLMF